jgi:hypothetical protein
VERIVNDPSTIIRHYVAMADDFPPPLDERPDPEKIDLGAIKPDFQSGFDPIIKL